VGQARLHIVDKGHQHETSGQNRKRDTEDIRDALKRLRDEKEIAFDSAGWKRAYLRWIVMDHQSAIMIQLLRRPTVHLILHTLYRF
jgi:hypothetical protein